MKALAFAALAMLTGCAPRSDDAYTRRMMAERCVEAGHDPFSCGELAWRMVPGKPAERTK
jgi:hypothetical protein